MPGGPAAAPRSSTGAPAAVELGLVDFAGSTPVAVLAGRNRTKADILVHEIAGRRVALKSYAARPWWFRNGLGRWMVRREAAAYRAAVGVEGIPAFLGRPDAYSLATEWIEGRSLPELGAEQVDSQVFETVRQTIASLHRRGIALADLHHRNVVVTGSGRPFVLDLAGAWVLGRRPGPLQRRLFQRLTELDYLALARMRARWTGADAGRAVAEHGGAIATWHRRGRRLKALLDRVRRKRRAPETPRHERKEGPNR